jgi:peptidyl-prolyl cis-trans isomerase SurA
MDKKPKDRNRGPATRRRWTACLTTALLLMWTGGGAMAAAQETEVVDRIAAVVNNDIILLSELEEKLAPYAEKVRQAGYGAEKEREMLYKIRTELLDGLIDQKLTDQEIKRYGISISEQQIDTTLERVKEANYYTDEELREGLRQQGMTLAEYRDRIREQLLRTELVNREVKSKIVVTEEDVQAYYEANPDAYGEEKKYHLRNIIMRVPEYAAPEEKAAIEGKMAAILAELKGGRPFAEAARQYSEALAEEGGDIGNFALDALAPEIREPIRNLSPGEFTDALETDLGFQIFYLEEVLESGGRPLDVVREEIQEKLYQEAVNEAFQAWLNDLRDRSHIKKVL